MRRTRRQYWTPLCATAIALLSSHPAAAIPVFARIYGKPCGACHVVFPEPNPAGEALRTHGLHGLTPAVEPIQLGDDGNDEIFRFGPDYTDTSRQVRLTGQALAGFDANPANRSEALSFYGGLFEGNYRFTPLLISLARFDYTGMPAFNDRPEGGTAEVHRHIWEATAGSQYLIRDNLKLVAEVTHSENHDAVTDSALTGWAATLRFATAFWPLSPPLLGEVLPNPWQR